MTDLDPTATTAPNTITNTIAIDGVFQAHLADVAYCLAWRHDEEQALFLFELFEELDAITRISRPEGQRSNALQEFEALYIATLAAYKANRDIPAELGATS